MVLALFSTVAVSAEEETSGKLGNCTWVKNGTELTISGSGMVSTDFSNFSWIKEITKVTVEPGVTGIETYAFYYYEKLKEVSLPDTIEKVEWNAFALTGIHNNKKDSHWDNSVLYIGSCLVTIAEGYPAVCTVKEGTTVIGEWAFMHGARLKEITIPVSVTNINDTAFQDCEALKTVHFKGTKAQWDKMKIGDGNDYLKNAEIICSPDLTIYYILGAVVIVAILVLCVCVVLKKKKNSGSAN